METLDSMSSLYGTPSWIEELHELSKGFDDMAIVKKMKEIVPEFKSQHSKYQELDK